MTNTVKETFKDYKNVSVKQILNCKVNNINLYKKSKRLEIDLEAEDIIDVGQIHNFEEYLKNKFGVIEVITNVKYKVKIKVSGEKKTEQKTKDTSANQNGTGKPVILRKKYKR